MSEFKKSEKTTRTPTRVPFQTKTRSQTISETTTGEDTVVVTSAIATKYTQATTETATEAAAQTAVETSEDVITGQDNFMDFENNFDDLFINKENITGTTSTLPNTISFGLFNSRLSMIGDSDPPINTGTMTDELGEIMRGRTDVMTQSSNQPQTTTQLNSEILRQLNEARTESEVYRKQLQEVEAERNAARQRNRQLEDFLQHRRVDEEHMNSELRVRDIEINRLQKEQHSLRLRVTQFEEKIKQMSSNTISNINNNNNHNNYNNNDRTENRIDDTLISNNRLDVGNSVEHINVGLGYNLKPDIYDGTKPLSEYLNQFNLIAKANNWNEEKKMIGLAASLRDKATSVLNSFKNTETLDLKTLLEKLEARFGEHLRSNSYSLFQNRRQKVGEDLPTLANDIEKLVTLAYPECSLEVQDKIACSQFIIGIYNTGVRETLQLERITSLKVALARALEVSIIKQQNRNNRNRLDSGSQQNDFKSSNNYPNSSEKNSINTKNVKEQSQSFNSQEWLKNLECWGCHKKGHTRSRCPEQGN